MRKKLPKILVAGGAGFIGSAFVRLLLNRDCLPSTKGLSLQEAISKDIKGTVPKLIVVDKLTYAGDLERLKEIKGKYKFYKADICNKRLIETIFKKEKPDTVVNFAASTHVDRSIIDATPFIETNVKGTQVLLDIARNYKIRKLIHISSDEAYGEISKGEFIEDSPLKPNSPYAASKAAADLLIRAYIRTYNFPAIIVRPSNNYGPWQYPEKFIPVIIYKALKNELIPVYGQGLNVREWLHVRDCADAILTVVKKGKIGEVYNVGSGNERKNIDIAKDILSILEKPLTLIGYVRDRPGHDFRYSLDFSRLKKELNWKPQVNFEDGLIETVNWYRNNLAWLEEKVKYLRNYWKKVYQEQKCQ